MQDEALYASGQVSFETAAEHASCQVPVFSPTTRAGDIRQSLVGRHYESATHLVICEDRKFCGILTIEELLSAPADSTAAELMDADPPIVAPGIDQEVAAWRAVKHAESALSVVDAEGNFIGLIPPHRLLAVLLSEHEEDLSRLGGFIKNVSLARITSEEAVPRRFWHRVPWLLLGLAGALVAADIVGWFETQLHDQVILAFFIPGIVYLADAVGTQTEMVVVRGLSVGVRMQAMVWRELVTGLIIGWALALLAYPIMLWRWEQTNVAFGVSLALFAACSSATFAAMALPWLLDFFDLDPAFGSGPLATVIQDLLSILIYFAIVTSIIV